MSDIQENQKLLHLNTFKIDAKSRYFTTLKSANDISELLQSKTYQNYNSLVLGGGSNILFTKDFEGLILKNEIKGIIKVHENDDDVHLKIGGGENWHEVVEYCVERNYGGIENLSLIPGCAGAAPVQNIGAYGVELKDMFVSLEAVNLKDGSINLFQKGDCQFAYRNSIFKNELKGQYLISFITLQLSKKPKINTSYGAIKQALNEMDIDPEMAGIRDVSKAVIKIRTSKLPDPSKIGNGGSFFKNPVVSTDFFNKFRKNFPDAPFYDDPGGVKIPAAWLIEQCGWKGKRFGAVGVYKYQPLVLVNYGGGSGREIEELSNKIGESVLQKFGIELTPEVNII